MKKMSLLGLAALVAVSFILASCANQGKGDLRRVHFDFDKSYIRTDMIPIMDSNVRYLHGKERHFSTKSIRSGTGMAATIGGHCDERGTAEYNYALGARRAEAAKSYLVSHGISAGKLKTVSYGEEKPLCKQHDESCWFLNRRAEFHPGN